jgi:hypothetical protein
MSRLLWNSLEMNMKSNPVLKSADETANAIAAGQLVDGVKLLEILFPVESRPTLRWLRNQQRLKRVPYRKLSNLVFFDPNEVREVWRDRFTVGR